MLQVREANNQDAVYIASNLRDADKLEFYRVTGERDALDNIIFGLNADRSITYCIHSDENPIALVGCIEKQDFKIVWACGTNEVSRYPKGFVAETKKLLERHKSEFKPYLNYVDAENKNAIRYLRHVGFKILDAIPYGKLDCKFHPFIWGK